MVTVIQSVQPMVSVRQSVQPMIGLHLRYRSSEKNSYETSILAIIDEIDKMYISED